MKKLVPVLSIILTCLILAQAAPPAPVNVVFQWDTPSDPMWTSYVYRIYGTTNLLAPTNTWPLVTVATNPVLGSNGLRLAFPIALSPAQYFFTMTASNLWAETGFSSAAATPAYPLLLNNLQLSR